MIVCFKSNSLCNSGTTSSCNVQETPVKAITKGVNPSIIVPKISVSSALQMKLGTKNYTKALFCESSFN